MSSHRHGSALLIAAALLTSACCLPRLSGPATRVLQQEPLEVTLPAQEMAVLAFVSYAGELLEGSDDEVERQLAPCLEKELLLQPLIGDAWQLVWGPAVYKFRQGKLDDNMMYAVRHRVDPARLVVGVRGTNAAAILDWLVEDLEVAHTEAWKWTQRATQLEPRISEATAKGLQILQDMKPTADIPGDEQTLRSFLATQVANAGVTAVTVVGHSLGGALAPALGLWLEDTRSEWDVKHRASVAVWAFAGPTPGDADFAAYYDQRLGNATRRIHNPYDAVPLAWQADQMETIPGLYQPEIKPLLGLRELVCLAIDATENKHYRQQLQDAPPITGHVFAGASKYLAQVGCQHTCGYYRGLDLVFWDEAEKKFVNRIKPITSDCQDFTPAPRCARCPDWGGDGH